MAVDKLSNLLEISFSATYQEDTSMLMSQFSMLHQLEMDENTFVYQDTMDPKAYNTEITGTKTLLHSSTWKWSTHKANKTNNVILGITELIMQEFTPCIYPTWIVPLKPHEMVLSLFSGSFFRLRVG